MYPRADCNPDTWNAAHPWNSSLGPAPVPAAGDTAPVDPAVGPTYFGQGGQWIDLYRFRYTLTDLTVRPITFTLARPVASIGHQFVFSNGSWALQGAPATVSVQPLGLNAGASGACCNGSSCLITGEPACAAISGQFNPAQTCVTGSPNNYVVCCSANFDRINGLGVPDIFAWINAFLAGDPRADADHNGTLELIDIFTFLNTWFAGCS
ncbi:MAG TPA: GC-type dockerin domain-anchored protein [Phycisphaerales bacterium]|nr:GC-type dockerin domain-anchored protein [Phycisphaerales bacterium]